MRRRRALFNLARNSPRLPCVPSGFATKRGGQAFQSGRTARLRFGPAGKPGPKMPFRSEASKIRKMRNFIKFQLEFAPAWFYNPFS